MRLRTSLVAGEIVTPASLALPGLGFGENPGRSPELPYELTFQLADLGPGFLALFDDWCEELRTSPDPADELAALLAGLDWPQLPALADRDPGALAAVLLVLGEDVLTELVPRRGHSAPPGGPPPRASVVAPRSLGPTQLPPRASLAHGCVPPGEPLRPGRGTQRGRDVAVPVRYAPNSVDEVELCGTSITLRGRAFWVQP